MVLEALLPVLDNQLCACARLRTFMARNIGTLAIFQVTPFIPDNCLKHVGSAYVFMSLVCKGTKQKKLKKFKTKYSTQKSKNGPDNIIGTFIFIYFF